MPRALPRLTSNRVSQAQAKSGCSRGETQNDRRNERAVERRAARSRGSGDVAGVQAVRHREDQQHGGGRDVPRGDAAGGRGDADPAHHADGLGDGEDAADQATPVDRHLVGDGRGDRGQHRVERQACARHQPSAITATASATASSSQRGRAAQRAADHPRQPPAAAASVVRSEKAPKTRVADDRDEGSAARSTRESTTLVVGVDRLGLLGEQHLDRAEEAGPQPDAGQRQARPPTGPAGCARLREGDRHR